MQSCRNTKGGYDCPCIEGYTRNNETGECDGKRDGGGGYDMNYVLNGSLCEFMSIDVQHATSLICIIFSQNLKTQIYKTCLFSTVWYCGYHNIIRINLI